MIRDRGFGIFSRHADGRTNLIFPLVNSRERGTGDFMMGQQLAEKIARERDAAAAKLAYTTGDERRVQEAIFSVKTDAINNLLGELEPANDVVKHKI